MKVVHRGNYPDTSCQTPRAFASINKITEAKSEPMANPGIAASSSHLLWGHRQSQGAVVTSVTHVHVHVLTLWEQGGMSAWVI